MEDSVFTKIIRGEIPAHKIYEDETCFAFLDIHPVLPGHVLVVPKKQVQFVWDLDDEDYQALMAVVKRIALRQRQIMAVPYVSSQVIGVDVPHSHVHLIPFENAQDLQVVPDMAAEPDHQNLAKIAESLAF